jgi:hypothetical protein
MHFSARLDETGTDGRSPYTLVGGAVATLDQWQKLEASWDRMLATHKVSAFHTQEFDAHDDDFEGWGPLKRKRFAERQAKICNRNTLFRIFVAVEDEAHSDVKQKMRGISGFRADSNYGLCLRYLMFLACETIKTRIAADFRLTLMVEDGPWAAGAADVYTRVSHMTGKWKPARHAHYLDGFAIEPKGRTRTLEAADYLVGVALKDLLAGKQQRRTNQTSILVDRPMMERWYEGMIKEKETRRAYGKRKVTTSAGVRNS